MIIFNQACNKCGKEPKPDKKKSTANWTVYQLNCKCGGRFETIPDYLKKKNNYKEAFDKQFKPNFDLLKIKKVVQTKREIV